MSTPSENIKSHTPVFSKRKSPTKIEELVFHFDEENQAYYTLGNRVDHLNTKAKDKNIGNEIIFKKMQYEDRCYLLDKSYKQNHKAAYEKWNIALQTFLFKKPKTVEINLQQQKEGEKRTDQNRPPYVVIGAPVTPQSVFNDNMKILSINAQLIKQIAALQQKNQLLHTKLQVLQQDYAEMEKITATFITPAAVTFQNHIRGFLARKAFREEQNSKNMQYLIKHGKYEAIAKMATAIAEKKFPLAKQIFERTKKELQQMEQQPVLGKMTKS